MISTKQHPVNTELPLPIIKAIPKRFLTGDKLRLFINAISSIGAMRCR
jgi:hypothetical protein